jgi:glycosyltransferase involved in cell wall biosynthesis
VNHCLDSGVDTVPVVRNFGAGTPATSPRVLFLTRPFPPCSGVGSIRPWNIARYLAGLGWEVKVVTPHPSIWRRLENDAEKYEISSSNHIHRILTDHGWRCLDPENLNYPNRGFNWIIGGACRKIARSIGIDSGIGFAQAAERACSGLTPADVDVILATGSPFASFALAKRLSDRLGCPFVLDYRDPWTKNMHAFSRVPQRVIQQERRLLGQCAAATVVSASWAKAMQESAGLGSRLHVIPNGYDPQELDGIEPFRFGHFAIVYTGVFYPPKRVISPVMSALRELKATMDNACPPWYFHYYGAEEGHVREEAVKLGVIEKVVFHGRVPRREALSAVKGANVAVVITSVSNEDSFADRGMIPAKIFEALGLHTPILLICPAGSDAAEIVRKTATGAVFSAAEPTEISNFLHKMILGQVELTASSDVQEWSWPQLIRRLDNVLKSAINREA